MVLQWLFFKRLISCVLVSLMAYQPLAGYAQPIGEALRRGDAPVPHGLPVTDRPDRLPLPYVPPQWSAPAGGVAKDAPKAAAGVDDDDDNILPTIIAVLKPTCTPLTASTQSAIIGDSITLTAHCTFKGNLQRHFGFYVTDPNGDLTYLNDSNPAGAVTFGATAPSVAGVYVYTMVALNGNIPAKPIGGVSVKVAANVPPAVAITTPGNSPALITYSLTNASTVTATANDVDQGVSNIQLQWKASGATSWSSLANCSFTPSVNASRLCSGSIPAGTVAGAYVVRAIATDQRGSATTSPDTAITVQPAALTCALSVNPNPPTAGTAATLTAACQSGGQAVTGLNFMWLGAASACGSSMSTTCQFTPSSTNLVSYGVTATKVNYATTSTAIAISANAPPLAALQCSLQVSPVKSMYSPGDTITLTPKCSSGLPLTSVTSNLVAQNWLINGVNSFDTSGVCFSNCPQSLTPAYLTNNLAGGTITYAVSVSGSGYASTSANVAINASNTSGALIANGGFESNAITNAAATQTFGSPGGQFAFGTEATNSDPNRVWVFNADSGVQRYGSLMSGANQPPPGGASSQQTGLVRAQGVLSTTVALAAGQYSLSFQMANRSNYGGQQAVQVRVAGTTLPGVYSPTTSFSSYSASFSVAAAGSKEIAFVGVNAGDNTALIDNVALTPVTSTLTPPSGCVASGPASLVSGQSGSFSVTCSAGSAPLTYAWSRTPTGFDSTAQSFSNTPFSSATTTVASATYSVNVSNAAGNQVVTVIVANGSYTGPPPTTATETLIFIHPDVKGSPLMATDANGAALWREDYSAFGVRRKNEALANDGVGAYTPKGDAANSLWYIGKPQDNVTGLVYFGARWYDPQVGRFMGFDPAGVDEGNPHSFNRYAYGNNNPYKYLDPDGRLPILLIYAAVPAATAIGAMAARAAPFVQRTLAAAMNTVSTLAASPATHAALDIAEGMATGGPTSGVASAGAALAGVAKEITLSRKLNGEAAQHAADAIKAGVPDVLTIERAGAAANRRASIGGRNKVPGKHLDEYPPAMFKEGGAGASVRAISPRDNMSAGACIGNACRGLPDGARVKITVEY
jgi:RHS repeat-associated protein